MLSIDIKIERLELKNTVSRMNKTLSGNNHRLDIAEENISTPKA
jgi:hypothetical protein